MIIFIRNYTVLCVYLHTFIYTRRCYYIYIRCGGGAVAYRQRRVIIIIVTMCCRSENVGTFLLNILFFFRAVRYHVITNIVRPTTHEIRKLNTLQYNKRIHERERAFRFCLNTHGPICYLSCKQICK